MTGTKRCASRKSEEGYKKVESCEEEELEPSGAAASAAPVGIEEREGVKEEEESKPLPEQPLPTESTEAADQAADSTPAVDQTAEIKEEKEQVVEGQEEEEPEQDPTVEPEGEAAASAAQPHNRAAELSPISSQVRQVSKPAGKFVAHTPNTPRLRSILRHRGGSR